MSTSEVTTEHSLPGSGDDPSPIPTWYGSIVFAILFVASVYLLVFLADMEQLNADEESFRNGNRSLQQVQEQQQSQLESYTWTDADNNRVSIPFQQGREKFLKRYGSTDQD